MLKQLLFYSGVLGQTEEWRANATEKMQAGGPVYNLKALKSLPH